MRHRDRGCLNKRRFETKEDCVAAIKRSGCRLALKSYRCVYGDHWHMTKVRPLQEVKRLSN